jgi:NADP-dependent 3-hydroxy acid dehydrogenase YdfG
MSNKTVFITGATGDFGKAFAKKFANAGYSLILHGRDQSKVDTLCALHHGSKGVVFDVTDTKAMRSALKDLPPVDILINNAGLALGLDKAHEANPDDWETMIDVDCKALVLITREILPGMVTRKSGHIINIGSTAGNYPYPGGNVYGAAKAFVKQFSLNLRSDLVGTNVRATNIEPGQVETQFSAVRFKGDEARAKAVYAGTQSLQADDVAEAVFWSASLPAHVNINRLEMMSTGQSFAGLSVERKPLSS